MENVEDPDKEISLEEARQIKKSYKVGDIVSVEETTKDFGRIAAQTAKQVVMQKLREMERQQAADELSEKEDELLTTVVKRIDDDIVYVQIAGTHTEGVLMRNDQIPGDKFQVGDRVKVYVKKIKESFRGPQVQVSRSNIGFVRKLFDIIRVSMHKYDYLVPVLWLAIPSIQHGPISGRILDLFTLISIFLCSFEAGALVCGVKKEPLLTKYHYPAENKVANCCS